MSDSEVVEIKRYPNRRYYARNTSSYVSLQDIEDIVKSGRTVEIRDSQSGDDLTRAVLTQIIIQRHPEKMALLPTDVLHHMLRSNDAMLSVMRDYFEHSLTWFDFLSRSNTAASPMAQPLQWFQAWIDTLNPARRQGHPPITPEEAAALHARLAELEARLQELESDS